MANILVMFYVCAEIDYAQVEATLKSHRGTGCDQRQIESRTINYEGTNYSGIINSRQLDKGGCFENYSGLL